MVASRDQIELLISKAKQNDALRNAIDEVEKRTFTDEVDLYNFLFNVIRIYNYHLYFWQEKMPTRKTIRAKLEKMIKEFIV